MEWKKSLPELWEWIFFIPFPFPNFGNGFFSFPSRSRILGMDFFIPFPFPNFGNGFFPFPSRSRISGIGFFNSLPVPESSKVIPAHPCLRIRSPFCLRCFWDRERGSGLGLAGLSMSPKRHTHMRGRAHRFASVVQAMASAPVGALSSS